MKTSWNVNIIFKSHLRRNVWSRAVKECRALRTCERLARAQDFNWPVLRNRLGFMDSFLPQFCHFLHFLLFQFFISLQINIFIINNCIVLKGWSLLPNALWPFQIYCAPPNLGIRMWICWSNFTQRPVFSGLRFFNEPEIPNSGPPA